jgi:exopolysaccharide biosynthesis operon protein EpsL
MTHAEKKKVLVVLTLLSFPAAAPAFQTIDNITWPTEGRFAAYPVESADGRPVRFYIYGGMLHDSNIFRLSNSANPLTAIGSTDKSDTIYRVGAGFKADIPVSRQRILLDAQLEHREFDRFTVLNHDPYRLGAAWKWVAGPQWSGDVGYSRRHYLSDLGDIQAPIKDMITEDRTFASGAFLATPRWRVRGAADWTKWDHSDATRATLDNRTASVTGGLDYMTPAGNSIGGQVKYSNGEFPNRQFVAGSFVDNNFKEWETSLVGHWAITGKSILDARVGYTSRGHDQVPQRDFDGVTGRLSYDWFVGPKTPLNFAVWREIRSIEDVSASYVLTQGWSIGPSWAPTEKLVFQAKYIREDRDYRGDPGFVLTGGLQRDDTFRGVSLSAGYAPRRNIELAVGVRRGERNSNIFGNDYDYTSVAANAKFRF